MKNSNDLKIARLRWQIIYWGCRILSAFVFCVISAMAQDQTTALVVPLKSDEPPNRQSIRPNPLDDENRVNWMLRDAITAALDNNPDIAIERKNVRITELRLRATQGVYDPVLTASPSYSSNIQPNVGRFTGLSATSSATITKSFGTALSLQKAIQPGGGYFQTSFSTLRTTSNSAILSPLYSPQLSFSFTQPLWRNRSIDLDRRNIYIARKTLTLTDAQFRQQVIAIIMQVQQAYWNLAFAIRNITVQKDGVALAQDQVDENQKQVNVGMLSPLDVISAKTVLETRRQALIQAINAAEQAQNALKTLVVAGTESELWVKEIFPSDFFEETPPSFSLIEALANAYANRPEAAELKVQKEINNIDVDYYRNQTKPQIDLVAGYGLTGAAGTPVQTLVCPTGTTLGTSLCIPGNLPPTVTTASVNPSFVGGYGTALGDLFSNQYRNVTVGVNISLPLRNRTAKAYLGVALETRDQTDLLLRKQLQTVEAEVRNAYQSVISAQKNLNAARLARQYAEAQLDGEQKRFASGLSTTFLVLTRQNDLIQARGSEIGALAAYNVAVAALQQATGSTLASNNIQIK